MAAKKTSKPKKTKPKPKSKPKAKKAGKAAKTVKKDSKAAPRGTKAKKAVKCCRRCQDYKYCDDRGKCCEYCNYYVNAKCFHGLKKIVIGSEAKFELADYRGDDYGIDDYQAYEEDASD